MEKTKKKEKARCKASEPELIINSLIENITEFESLKLIKIFNESNFNIGKLIKKLVNPNDNIPSKNKIKEELTQEEMENSEVVLFRVIYLQENLFFLFWNFSGNLAIGRQSQKEIQDLNKKINPALEFSEISALISFLQENLFSLKHNSFIFKNLEKHDQNKNRNNLQNTFNFESFIDIVKVKWEIPTFEISDNEFSKKIQQKLFIQPFVNTFCSLQEYIEYDLSKNMQKMSINNNISQKTINPEKSEPDENIIKTKNQIKCYNRNLPVNNTLRINKFTNDLIIESSILLNKNSIMEFEMKRPGSVKIRNSENKNKVIFDATDDHLSEEDKIIKKPKKIKKNKGHDKDNIITETKNKKIIEDNLNKNLNFESENLSMANKKPKKLKFI